MSASISSENSLSRRQLIASAACAIGTPRAKYRVAILGATGRGDYGHEVDNVWLDIPDCEIAAVSDADETGRKKAVERLRAPKSYADYHDMLKETRPDFAAICPRWVDQHRDMLAACADVGVKGVLMEKPLARTPHEADEMVAIAEKTGMKVALAHQTRYSPRIAQVKRLMEQGRLGDILEAHGRCKEDTRGGGQDFMVLGDHLMDLLRHFLGEAEWCFGRVTENGKPITQANTKPGAEEIGLIAGDSIYATYGFKNDVVATVGTTKARHAAGARFGLTLYGTKGAVTMQTGYLGGAWFLEDPSWNHFLSGGKWLPVSSQGVNQPEIIQDAQHRAGNVEIVKDLIASVEGNKQPLSNIRESRACIEMILAPYASQLAGKPVTLPLESRRHPLET